MTTVWLLALLALAPQVTGPSLLPAGGFETAAGWSGSAPADWGDCAGSFARVATQPYGGGWCGEVRGVRLRYMVAAERLNLVADQAYLLRGWVRTALAAGESAYLAASFTKAGKFTHVSSSRRLTGGQPWTRLELLLPVSTRQGAEQILVSFRVESSSGTGAAWVDDVELLPVTLPPPPSRVAQEQARQRLLVRTFLVQREFWTDRLATLQQRRRDVEALLAGDPATWQRRETRPRGRPALEAAVPREWAALQPRLGQLADLPRLQAACLSDLEAILARKRQLDATPEKRRAWLRAQLPGPRPALSPAPTKPLDAALAAALQATVPPAAGDLGEVRARAGWTPTAWLRGTVALPRPQPGDELLAALRAPDGQVIWWQTRPAAASSTLAAADLAVTAWSPERPVLYELAVALRRGGQVVDLQRAPLAFRDLAVTAGDLSGTMRHAWGWAADDSSYRLNGQPWFPRGTVLNDLSRHLEPSVALLQELGLEFQRNYGYQTGNISGRLGDQFRQHGLLLLAGLGPSYPQIGTFESREAGFESFREEVRQDRALVDDPAVLALQVGNEAELAVWGADLGSSYGEDLWQPFEEAIAVVREETDPAVPVSYVRAGSHKTVAPVPAEDYSGINQYAGRYWGTRRTISADLGGLGFHAAAAGKPYGVTEWFGPKYSWATSGISGVDEAGAARYLVDYQQALERAPGAVLSTQFVLNWVVTPVEDLTTLPYAEGRRRREEWSWSLQQGTPWYPHVFPNLLTDTPARRQLRGLNSPLHDLVEAPGRLLVSGPAADAATAAGWLRDLGRSVEVVQPEQLPAPAAARASVLLLAPGPEPAAWLREFDLTAAPAAGQFVLRRRLLPADPDRLVVVLRGGDVVGYAAGLARLRGDAAGLTEAYAQRASCRRLLALVDTDNSAFERYVTDTAMRGWFVARDDLRQRLDATELLTADGTLQPAFADLALLLVTVKRALDPAELTALRTLARLGVEVVWSAGTLAANPLPGVSLGAPQDLTGPVPVATWAQQPLLVTDLGQVRGEALSTFGGLAPDSPGYRAATTARLVQAAGDPAATAAGQPVVVRQSVGEGAFWYCGADLVALADALTRTTQRGVNHGLYDRDTACGLERWFRLLTNAGARRAAPRPAARPRLRCDVQLDHLVLPAGGAVGATVVVRNQDGALTDATVRGALLAPSGSNYGSSPRAWRLLQRHSEGRYRLDVPADQLPPPAALSVLDSRLLGVWINAEAPGHVGDWTVASLAAARVAGEADRLARLVDELRQGVVRLPWGVTDEQQYIEVQGTLTVRPPLRAGVPAQLGLTIRQIESDEGNDAMESVELLLQPPAGPPLVLPVAPGKVLCSPKQATVKAAPTTAVVVTSEQPFELQVPWANPTPGLWRVGLRYLYTDDYRSTIRRVPRTDWLPAPTLEVQ